LATVFVDLDSTLIRGSSEKSFFLHLLRRGRLRPGGLLRFGLGYLLHLPETIVHGPGWNRLYLSGLDAEAVRGLATGFSQGSLVPRIRPAVASELEGLRRAGASLVILSAALEWLVEPLGRAVGADRVIGSRLRIKDGKLTGGLDGARPFGADKLLIVVKTCEQENLDPAGCTAYGDSWADRHVLGYCGTAVAVNPGPKLSALARDRGWRIIEPRR
jgi:HAD superfamily hydrolase (TIGR01490 family)